MMHDLMQFGYWLDGYSDEISDVPTRQQWAKIKERLDATLRPKPSAFNEQSQRNFDPTRAINAGNYSGGR